jgi:DNA-binding phage protein
MTTHRPTDEATVAMLKADPLFAATYLTVALDEAGEPGGKTALLAALRNVATAHDLDLTPGQPGPEPDEKPAA